MRKVRRERRHTIGASSSRMTGKASSAPREPDMKAAATPARNPASDIAAIRRSCAYRKPTAQTPPNARAIIPKRIGFVAPPGRVVKKNGEIECGKQRLR